MSVRRSAFLTSTSPLPLRRLILPYWSSFKQSIAFCATSQVELAADVSRPRPRVEYLLSAMQSEIDPSQILFTKLLRLCMYLYQ